MRLPVLKDNIGMKEIVKVLLQEGINETTIHEILNVLEKWGENSGRATNGTWGKNGNGIGREEDDNYTHNKNNALGYKDTEMSPDEYIKKSAGIFKKSSGSKTKKSTLAKNAEANRSANREKIEKYKSRISHPTDEIDMPYLDYKTNRQEGLHRAIAAKELGHKKIPVRIFHGVKQEQEEE